jgi:hypothetical protein
MTPMEISDRIRKALKASGLKSPEVAAMLSIEPTSVRLFKNGTRELVFDPTSNLRGNAFLASWFFDGCTRGGNVNVIAGGRRTRRRRTCGMGKQSAAGAPP